MTRGSARRRVLHIPEHLRSQCVAFIDSARRAPALESPEALRTGPFFAFDPADGSLESGYSGVALLHHELARSFDDGDHDSKARAFLDAAIQTAVDGTFCSSSLLAGVTGLGWLVDFMAASGALEGEDPNEEIDAALGAALKLDDWHGRFDLSSGLVGMGLYALGRGPRGSGPELLGAIVDRLERTAVQAEVGIAWLTAPESFDEESRGERATLHLDLGLAHGIAGCICLLSFLHERGLGGRIKPLLEGAVECLLHHRLPGGGRSLYPPYSIPGVPPAASRLAWCQGDLCAAIALSHAARALGRNAWRQAAGEAIRLAAQRSSESAWIVDCGLCHGALGAAHLFHRLWQMSGEPLAEQAALRWLEAGLGMHLEGAPDWALRTQYGFPGGERRMVLRAGFLNGIAGALLAVLGIMRGEAHWDEILLASPPRIAES